MPSFASALNIFSTAKSIFFAFCFTIALWFCSLNAKAQTITVGALSGRISTCVGTASSAPNLLSFKLTVAGLTGPVRIKAPADFQVMDLDPPVFVNTVTVNVNGSTYDATVYVRTSERASAGPKSGDVVISTNGAADVRVPVTATVNPLPIVNPVFDQALTAGKNTLPLLFTGTAQTYAWTNDHPEIGLAAKGSGNIAAFTTVNNTGAPITATITVTPKPADLLYIANSESNSISVVNVADHTVVDTKPVALRPNRTIASPDGKHVYISYFGDGHIDIMDVPGNTISNNLYSFDLQNLMQFTPDGKKLYQMHGYDFVVVRDLLDPTKNKEYGDQVAHIQLSPDGKHLLVSYNSDRSIVSYSTATDTEEFRIDIGNCGAFLFSPDGNRIYMSSWTGEFLAVNLVTRKIEFQTTLGGSRASMAISPDGSRVYTAGKETGKMSVFNTLANSIVATIPAQINNDRKTADVAGVLVSPDGKYVYVRRRYGQILKINTADNSVANTIVYPADMSVAAFSPDGSRLYLAGEGLNPAVHVIDVATDFEIAKIPTGLSPYLDSRSFVPGAGCEGTPITFRILVKPAPSTLTATTATGNIQACLGTASSGNNLQQFTVTGKDLNSNIKATAPAGFEISLSNDKNFGNTIDIPHLNGVANVTVYVRASATPGIGTASGDVTLSTGGADDVTVRVNATINALPVVDKVADQKVVAGNAINAVNFTGTADDYVWTNDLPEIGLPAAGVGDIASFKPVNKTGANVTATVTVTPKPADYMYVANYMHGLVDIVNINTNKVVKVGVGTYPQRTLVTRDGKYVFVSCWGDGNVAVIDPVTKRNIKTIPVRANPTAMVLSRDGSRLYVTSERFNDISVIDVGTLTVEKYIPVGVITNEAILSPDGRYLYAGMSWTHGKTVALNTATEQVDATLNVSLDEKARFSADGSSLFSTDQGANLYMISTIGIPTAKTINVTAGGMRMAVTADGRFVYATHETLDYISVFSASTGSLVTNIPYKGNNLDMASSPDGKYMYVVSFSTILMIDVADHSVKKTFTFRGEGGTIAVSPDGTHVYVCDKQFSEIHDINVATGAISSIPSEILSHFSSDSFRLATGCVGDPISFKITVEPPPSTLTAGKPAGSITTCAGTPSTDVIQFTATGNDLTADIKASASSGFEISLSRDKDFANTLSIPQVNGDATAVIYVRLLTATTAGPVPGEVILSTGGSKNVSVVVSAQVTPLPKVDPVADQKVAVGSMTAAVNFKGNAQTYAWTNDHPEIGLPASGRDDIAAFKAINTTFAPITANVTVTPKPVANIYIVEDFSSNLAVVNSVNNQRVTNIAIGSMARRIVFTRNRKHIYITNTGSNSVSLIDAVQNKPIRTYTGIDEPVDVWVTPDESKMFVSNRSGTAVTAVDLATGKINNVIAVKSEQNAAGVLSPDGSRLYLCGTNNLTVIDTRTDVREREVPVTGLGGVIQMIPDGTRLFIPDRNGNIAVIDTKTYSVTRIPVAPDLANLYMSADGSRLYTTSAYAGHLYIMSTATNNLVGDIDIGSEVSSLAISPDGKWVYITSYYHRHLTVVNTSNNATERIPLSAEQVLWPILSNDGTRLFATGGNGVIVVDLISKKEMPVIAASGASAKVMGAELGCIGDPITFKITVEPPPPGITATGTLSPMRTTYGTASQASSVSVTGVNMADGILVTPPAGFEVSLDNVTFSSTVKAGSAGNVGPLTVYIRLAATTNAGNNYTGDMVLSGTGATSVKVTVPVSVVAPAQLDIYGVFHKTYGDNVPDVIAMFDATGVIFDISGLKNGNTFRSVKASYGTFGAATTIVGTYGTGVKLSDLTGDNGYLSTNYSVNYRLSVLEVVPAALTITAKDANKYYGSALTPVIGSTEFTVDGIKNNERVGTVDITYGAGSAVTDAIKIYEGSVKAGNARGGTFSAGNYTITYKNGNINVGTPPPAIVNVLTAPAGLSATYGDVSAASSFKISGTYLLGPITVTPPAGFEVSADGVSYGSTANVGNVGSVNNVMVYIRLAARTDAGPYSGGIGLKAGVATATVNMPLSTVSPRSITLKAEDDTRNYGIELTNYVGPQKYKIVLGSLKNGNTINTVAVSYRAGNAANSVVGRYENAAELGAVTGANGYLPGNYTILRQRGDVYITPASLIITANTATKVYGEAISGKTGSSDFTPEGLKNGESVMSITTKYASDPAAATAKAGTYEKAITASEATGGTFVATNYIISYQPGNIVVNKATLTVKADDQKRTAGKDNPTFTFNITGFRNNDSEAMIRVRPVAATTATIASQAGTYPITLSGGADDNYTFTYVNGMLTVEGLKLFTPATLGLPNAFTPNNDNINDTWNLTALSAYPKCTVNIFDRYGRQLFSTIGYAKAWDGRYNGADLPTGVYYYVIDLKNGENPVAGHVTLIR